MTDYRKDKVRPPIAVDSMMPEVVSGKALDDIAAMGTLVRGPGESDESLKKRILKAIETPSVMDEQRLRAAIRDEVEEALELAPLSKEALQEAVERALEETLPVGVKAGAVKVTDRGMISIEFTVPTGVPTIQISLDPKDIKPSAEEEREEITFINDLRSL